MHTPAYLIEFIYFLAAAVVAVPVFKVLKLSSVLGYLAAGFVIGPSVLGLISTQANMNVLAEFGVIFLLFLIGMELSFERLKLMRRYILGLGGLQVGLTAVAIGAIAVYLGLSGEVAVVVALALALSSTAFVMQLLMERDEQMTEHGRLTISILLMQDLAVVPILALLPILGASEGGTALGTAMFWAILTATGAIIAMVVAGKLVLRPLYRMVAMAKAPELFPAVTLLILLGSGAAMMSLGISMTLGAFLCGLLIAETEYHHQVETDIAPFKGMLLGLFFMTVGIGLDLPFIIENIVTIATIVLALLLVKAAIIALLCLAFGINWPTSGRVGMLLAQGGEFAFVILGTAATLGVVPLEISQTLIAAVAISMIATPFMDWLGRYWNILFHSVNEQELSNIKGNNEGVQGHVIIAGFGRVGQTAARMLSSLGIPYIALDMNHDSVYDCRNKGMSVYYGNATLLPVLRDAKVTKARAVLLTLDNKAQANKAVNIIKKHFPEVPVISRSRDADHAKELAKLGAEHAVPDLIESSLQLGAAALHAVGVSDDTVADTIQKMRTEE